MLQVIGIQFIVFAVLYSVWRRMASKINSLQNQLDAVSTMVAREQINRLNNSDIEGAVKNQLESVRLVVSSHVGSAGNCETSAKKHDPYRTPHFSASGICPETFDNMKIRTKVSG